MVNWELLTKVTLTGVIASFGLIFFTKWWWIGTLLCMSATSLFAQFYNLELIKNKEHKVE